MSLISSVRSESPDSLASVNMNVSDVTLETVTQGLKVLQGAITASFENIAQVEYLASEALRFLHEEGAKAVRNQPQYASHIEYLKFMVLFDVADEWITRRLSIQPDQAYTLQQQQEMAKVYNYIIFGEQYLSAASPCKNDLPRYWDFNALWAQYMKSFCLIGMNARYPDGSFPCTSCQGVVTLVDLMQNVDPLLRQSSAPGCEQLIANVRDDLNALALRADSQCRQGSCVDDTAETNVGGMS